MSKIIRRFGKAAKLGAKLVYSPREAKTDFMRYYHNRQNYQGGSISYTEWFKGYQPSAQALQSQAKRSARFKQRLLISVILPVYNTKPKHLRQAIESVIAQSYPIWELCIADDASTTNDVVEIVKEYAARLPQKIKWVRLKQNLHIAGASNAALKLATGEFVALLDHDDLLMPNALYEVAKVLNRDPTLDFIYSDEDKVDDKNRHHDVFFKPGWSPEFLKSCNYITHLAVLRRSIVKRIGGFRLGTEGAQDWDLFLRFTGVSQAVYHIAQPLYAWRKTKGSTAVAAAAKPYAYINQHKVLRDAVKAEKNPAAVLGTDQLGFWNVKYYPRSNPPISIIVPSKDSYRLIKECLDSIIAKTAYSNFEVILVDSGSTDQKVHDFYQKMTISNPVKVVNWTKPFNFAGACNLGAQHADGDYLLFLNNDTVVLNEEWLENMLGFAQQPAIGMVGAKLIFPNGRIQHAGVVLSERDVAFHPFYKMHASNIITENVRNCSAVTAACAMVAKSKFNKVGGFDEKLRVTYNDVDLCLKLLRAGYRNVYTPHAKLIHYESKSVGRMESTTRNSGEVVAAGKLMRRRWRKLLAADPYYNPNFVQFSPGYRLRKPTKVTRDS